MRQNMELEVLMFTSFLGGMAFSLAIYWIVDWMKEGGKKDE